MGQKTIIKNDLVDMVFEDKEIQSYGLSRKEIAAIIDRYSETFKAQIIKLEPKERIELRGFGTFLIRQRKPRNARNPKTGEPVKVPARKAVQFKPGSELKEKFKA